ncbi:MAG: discoidin domain-containing protein, partial [Clostridiales bacterium]|nr:discoidin domain-containing protein [Clostridiales bacterium]
TITLPENVVSAKEVNMLEHDYEGNKALAVNGSKISFNIEKYEILTLEVELAAFDGAEIPVVSENVDLSRFFNLDGVSGDEDRRDGDLDGNGNTVPMRNWPAEIDYQGVKFKIADTVADGENNYVQTAGQTIPLPNGNFSKVFLIGAAAGYGDPTGDFTIHYTDGSSDSESISFAAWDTDLSGWNRFEHMDTKPYVYDTVAHVFTHYHDGVLDQMTRDNYLFIYSIDTDKAKTVKSITLPEVESIKIAAISAADSDIAGFGSVYGSSNAYLAPPDAPTDVKAVVDANGIDVTVSWTASESENVLNYMVYGGLTEDFALNTDTLLGMVPAARNSFVYSPDLKGTFYFKVVASDRNVASSEPSEPSQPVTAGLNNYCLTAQRVWAVYSENAQEMDVFACDGDYGTKWCATGITSTNQRGYLNVQLVPDSAEPIAVERFKIAHAGVAEQTSYNTTRFDIDYSLDGQTWTNAVRVLNNTESITAHPLATPVYARYVRLNVIAGSTARIYEFMAFGDENVTIKPIAKDPKVAAVPVENDRVRFEANYTFFSGNPSITEGASTYAWALKIGDEYQPISATGKSVSLSNNVLAGASAIRCTITPIDNTGLAGDPADAEMIYNTPGSDVLFHAALVSSSGAVNAGETADKMVDGLIGSKWCQEGISPQNPGVAVFDMGATYQMASFKLFHSASDPDAQAYDKQNGINTRDYQIAVSLDGETWTDIVDVSGNMDAITEDILETPALARFVRLTVTLPNSGLFVNPPIDSQQALRVLSFEGYGDFVGFGNVKDGVFGTVLVDGTEIAALAEADGKTIDAEVTVRNEDGTAEKSVFVVAALYDAAGVLADVQSDTVTAAAGKTENGVVSIGAPENTAGMCYKLFLWDGESYAPLAGAVELN